MMSLVGLLRQLACCISGAAALEAALVLPVAIILMAGGVEFGQLFSVYGTAAKSMRDATRYLARVPQASICDTWALNNAKNLAVYGTLDSKDATPLIPGWTPEDVCTNLKPCTSMTDGGLLTLVSPSCPVATSSFITIELSAAVPYTGLMFGTIGLSNAWTINVKHQERSIGE
jgi:Flp pilus assembly protein TadG